MPEAIRNLVHDIPSPFKEIVAVILCFLVAYVIKGQQNQRKKADTEEAFPKAEKEAQEAIRQADKEAAEKRPTSIAFVEDRLPVWAAIIFVVLFLGAVIGFAFFLR